MVYIEMRRDSPVNFFKPSRLPEESRPLEVVPPPFLVDVRIWIRSPASEPPSGGREDRQTGWSCYEV